MSRRTVFLDTVGLIAVWDKADQWHADARAVFEGLLADRAIFITTPYVLLECGNFAARQPYRASVDELRQSLEEEQAVIGATADEWTEAWAEFTAGTSKQPGIVDLLSFRVMRRFDVLEAFTNDKHFRAAGFITLF